MFESVISEVITRVLGSYVEGFNKENIKIGALKGDVKLKDLSLKRDSLDRFSLPIHFRCGKIGNVIIKVPWKNLKSKPLIVDISEILIILNPRSSAIIYDEAAEEEKRIKQRKKELAEYEQNYLLSRKKGRKKEKEKKKEKIGFKEKLIQRILNNIQVKVEKLHVRYEDDISTPGLNMAMGIILENVRVEATDSEWKPFIKKNLREDETGLVDRIVYKSVSMLNLSMYMNTDTNEFLSRLSDTEALERLHNMIHDQDGLCYILHPLSSDLHLTINNKPEPHYQLPRLAMQSVLNNIELTVSEQQIHSIMQLVRAFTQFRFRKSRGKYRPAGTPKKEPIAWFKYAVHVVIEQNRVNRGGMSWESILEKILLRKRYVELFKKIQGVQWHPPPTTDELEELMRLENTRDVNTAEIIFFRSLARKEILEESSKFTNKSEFKRMLKHEKRRRRKELEEKMKKKKSQMKGLKRSISRKKGTNMASLILPEDATDQGNDKEVSLMEVGGDAEEEESRGGGMFELTDDERAELYATVGYEENATEVPQAPPEYVMFKIEFQVVSSRFTFEKDVGSPVFDVEMGKLASRVDIRPEGGKAVEFSLGSLKVIDKLTVGTQFPHIASERGQFAAEDVFHAKLEMNPVGKSVDVALDVDLKPIDIVYSHEVVKELLAFVLVSRHESDGRFLEIMLVSQFQRFRALTQDQVLRALEETKKYAIRMALHAPKIHIPQDNTMRECVMLVIDLGMTDVLNKPSKWRTQMEIGRSKGENVIESPSTSEASTLKHRKPVQRDLSILSSLRENDFYDSFDLYLSRVRILVGRTMASSDPTGGPKDVELVDSFDARVSLRKSLLPNDLRLPHFILEGSIGKINARLNSLKLCHLVDIAHTLVDLTTVFKKSPSEAGDLAFIDAGEGKHIGIKSAVRALGGSENRNYDFYEDEVDFDDTESTFSTSTSPTSLSSEISSETSSNFEGLGEEETLVLLERILLRFNFKLEEVSLHISRSRSLESDALANNIELVTLKMENISVTGRKRTYDIDIGAVLGKFELRDNKMAAAKTDVDRYAADRSIIAAGGGDRVDFLKLKIHQVNVSSPVYERVKINVETEIGSLYAHMNQEIIAEVLSLLIVSQWQDLIPPQSEDDAALSLRKALAKDVRRREYLREIKNLQEFLPPVESVDEQEVAVCLSVSVESFVFFVDDAERETIARGFVKKVELEVRKRQLDILVNGEVADIHVYDGRERNSLYSEVISPFESELPLLEFGVKHNSTKRTFLDPFAPSNAISFRWRPLCLAFPFQMINTLTDAFASGPLKDTIFTLALKTKMALKVRSNAARKRLQSKLGGAITNVVGSKDLISLDIQAEAPLVVIPRRRDSNDVVSVQFGTISVSTRHFGKEKRREHIHIVLENASIKRGKFNATTTTKAGEAGTIRQVSIEDAIPITSSFRVEADVRRPIDPDYSVPQMDMEVKLGTVEVSVLDKHIAFLYETLDNNLSEFKLKNVKEMRPVNLMKKRRVMGARRRSSFRDAALGIVDKVIEPGHTSKLEEALTERAEELKEEEPSTFRKIVLGVSMEKAEISLEATDDEKETTQRLIVATVTDFIAEVKTFSDKSMTFNLLLGSVSVVDGREDGVGSNTAFREILVSKSKANFLHFNFSKTAELKYAQLSLSHPQIVVIPEVVMDAIDLITPEKLPLLEEKTRALLKDSDDALGEDDMSDDDLSDTSSFISGDTEDEKVSQELTDSIMDDIRNAKRRRQNAKSKVSALAKKVEDKFVGKQLLEIGFDISNARIVIPEDPTNILTRAIVIQGSGDIRFKSTGDHMRAHAAVNRFMLSEALARSVLDMQEEGVVSTERRIVRDPVNMKLAIGKSIRNDEPLDIEGDVSVVALMLSYNGFRFWFDRILSVKERALLMQGFQLKGEIKEYIRARKAAKSRAEERAQRKRELKRKRIKKNLERSVHFVVDDSIVLEETQGDKVKVLDPFKNHGKLTLAGLFMTVLNDCGGRQIPVAEISLTRTMVEFRNIPRELKLNGECRVKMDYFNHTLISWEPLLEPFSFHVTAIRSVVEPPDQQRAIAEQEKLEEDVALDDVDVVAPEFAIPMFIVRVEFQDKIDVTASHSVIRETLGTLQTWVEDIGRPQDVVPEEFHPFSIENRTGIELFWSAEDTEGGEMRSLSPGGKIPINLALNAYATGSRESSRIASIGFIPFKNWNAMRYSESHPTVQQVPFDRVGFQRGMLLIPPELAPVEESSRLGDKIPRKICYEVFSVTGARTLVVGSSLLVRNMTGQCFELRVISDGKVRDIGIVGTEEDFYVPVHLAFLGTLLTRPDKCEWHTLIDHKQWNGKETTSRLSFSSILSERDGKSPEPVRTHFSLKRRSGFDNLWEIVLRSELLLHNALPTRLQYRISLKKWRETVVISTGVIDAFKTVIVKEVDSTLKANIEIRIENYDWSKMLSLKQFFNSSDTKALQYIAVMTQTNYKDKILALNMKAVIEEHYSRKISIYAPYWLLNETSNNIILSDSASKERGIPPSDGKQTSIQLLSDSRSSFTDFGTKRRRLRVVSDDFTTEVSEWSEPFYTSSVGMLGTILAPPIGGGGRMLWAFGLQISLSDESPLTRVLTMKDRYVIRNKTEESITVRAGGIKEAERIHIKEGDSIVFKPVNMTSRRYIQIKIGESEWGGMVDLDAIGDVTLPVREIVPEGKWEDVRNPERFVGVEVRMEGPQTHTEVYIQEKRAVPYTIQNKTRFNLIVRQRGVGRVVPYFVHAKSREVFAWDEPAADHVVVVTYPYDEAQNWKYRVDKLKLFGVKLLHTAEGEDVKIFAAVRAKGPRKTLLISEHKIYSLVDKEDIEEKIFVRLEVKIPEAAFSLVDHTPRELLYATASGNDLVITYSNASIGAEFQMRDLQMDNQNHDARYPVMVYADQNNPKDRPFLHFSVIKSTQYKDVHFFKYASILVQSFNVELDETHGDQFLTMFNKIRPLIAESKEQIREAGLKKRLGAGGDEQPTVARAKAKVKRKKRLYFQFLQLHPIRCNVSYASSHMHKEAHIATPLDNFMATLGETVVNLDHAAVRFNALILEHAFVLPKTFVTRVSKHYAQQFAVQVYRILGSAEILGNPVGFVSNVGAGVYDFFYEPAQGLVKSPQDFGVGIASGTMKLVRSTLYGTFGSVGDFTSAIGKGAAVLTLDSEFIHSREVESRRNAPRNVFDGVYKGTGSVASGIYGGTTGVISQPFKGAMNGGITGFSSGAVKGVTGLVFKPVVGGIDGLSKSALGVKNMTRSYKTPPRKRHARPITIDGVIQQYSAKEAEGKHLLDALGNEEYSKERYRFHFHLSGSGIVIMTNFRLIFLDERGREKWNIHFDDILEVKTSESSVMIISKRRRSNLFGGYEDERQVHRIEIPNDTFQEKLILIQTKILSIVASYSESKHERRVVSLR